MESVGRHRHKLEDDEVDLMEIGQRVGIGFIWLRMGSIGEHILQNG
jgi:hypothetical protein